MDVFFLIVFGGLALVVLVFVFLGTWSPRSISDLTGRTDKKRWETQATVEGADIGEMVDAHNESRRRRGKAEVSEAEIRARADETQRASIERSRQAPTDE